VSRSNPVRRWSRLLRTATLTVAVVTLPLALAASCSDPREAPPADAGSAEASEGGSADAAGSPDATTCAAPAPDPARCSGNDPAFVFFPPLTCDLATVGADASVDAAHPDASSDAAADAGLGPCYGVTTLDVAFTPASCAALLGAESGGRVSTDGGSRAPQITEPADGDILTPDSWSLFAWNPPMTLRSPMQRVLDWIEPSAYATSPLNGEGYSLEFSQGCTEFLRVMVAAEFWEPDPVSWALLSSRIGPINVRVVAAKFASDAILPGTALQSASVTITMMH
jgi:hypothetical protein